MNVRTLLLFLGLVVGLQRTAAQDTWTNIVAPTTQTLQAICWGNGQFVAVGDAGTILTSTDGLNWLPRNSGTTNKLLAVTFGANLFVATGETGTMLSSSDGIAWVSRSSGTPQAMNGIAYGDGRFLAVGDGATALTSTDGTFWTRRTVASATSLRGVTYAYGQFVITGDRGDVRVSANGSSFLAYSTNRPEYLTAVGYARHRFVILGSGGYAYRSSDGRSYKPAGATPRIDSADLRGLSFFNDSFIAVGSNATIVTSVDGVTWSRRVLPTGTGQLHAVASAPDVAVAVGERGAIWRSQTAQRAPAIVVAPETQAVDYGNNLILTVVASGTAPLQYQWSLNGNPIAGATQDRLFVENFAVDRVGEFAVTVTNPLGRVSAAAQVSLGQFSPRGPVALPPLIDSSFSAEPAFDSVPRTAVELGDGRILVGGAFAVSSNGTTQHGLVTLNAEGLLDRTAGTPSLNPGGRVEKLITQPDGRILVLGDFTSVNGTPRANLARLLADGSLDATFAPPEGLLIVSTARIHAQGEGGLLVAGLGDGRRLHRLAPDGSLDPAFAGQIISAGTGAVIRNAVVDAGGGVLVACSAANQTFLARLLPDGRQDPAFTTYFSFGADSDVPLLALGERDRVLYVRATANGTGNAVFGSLGIDGTPDSESRTFGLTISSSSTGTARDEFRAAVQAKDRRVVVARWFASLNNGEAAINRYRSDGQPDASLSTSRPTDGDVTGIAPLRDGRILILGNFTTVYGVRRPKIARLLATNVSLPPPTIMAGVDPESVTVGTGQPFTLQARMNAARSSVAWYDEFNLFMGAPRSSIAGGSGSPFEPMEFTFANPGTYYLSGMAVNFDSTFVHCPFVRINVLNQPDPIILRQPQATWIFDPSYPTFSVTAAGNNITYQWLLNGVPIPGATSRTYSPFAPNPASIYTVRIGNARGSVTSEPVKLPPAAPPVITYGPTWTLLLPSSFVLGSPFPTTATAGMQVTFEVTATGSPPLSYQWLRNGTPIAGATRATLVLSPARLADSGSYSVTVTNFAGSVSSKTVPLKVDAVPRISNLSIRTSVAGNAEPLTLGLTISGSASLFPTKPLLLRAIGPTLAGFGVSGALPDPQIALLRGTAIIGQNDDWGGDSRISAASAAVGAFGFVAANSKDAALIQSATSGSYTVRISAAANTSGTALAEIYDATSHEDFLNSTPRLSNVSALTRVGAGGETPIVGFSIAGDSAVKLLVRAIGPTLGNFGVTGVLADPKLDLFQSGIPTAISSNDNWGAATNATQVAAASASVGAFSLAPDSKDAVLLVTLPPGSYTAQVSGVNNTSGAAIVEVYEVP